MTPRATVRRTIAIAIALPAWNAAAFAQDARPTTPSVVVAEGAIDATRSGPTVAERFAAIQRRVDDAVVYPPIARFRGVTGESQIEFSIDRAGTPFDLVTLESSGSATLDRAAVRAIEQAAPLPWLYGRIIVPVRFELHGES